MADQENYDVTLTSHEIHSLLECLSNLRKIYAADSSYGNYKSNPVFRSASELQYKFAKVVRPESSVTLDDYLNY